MDLRGWKEIKSRPTLLSWQKILTRTLLPILWLSCSINNIFVFFFLIIFPNSRQLIWKYRAATVSTFIFSTKHESKYESITLTCFAKWIIRRPPEKLCCGLHITVWRPTDKLCGGRQIYYGGRQTKYFFFHYWFPLFFTLRICTIFLFLIYSL